MDFEKILNDLKQTDKGAQKEYREPEVMEDMPPAPKDVFDLAKLSLSLIPYREKVTELVVKSRDHQITNTKTNERAVEMASQLSALRKNLDAARKDTIAPYDNIVRGINKLVKDFRDSLNNATTNLKGKMGRYAREQAEIARRIAVKKAEEEAEARRIQAEKDRKAAQERQRIADEEAARKQKELDALAEKEGVESVTVEAEKIEIPEIEETVVEEVKTGPIKTGAGTMSTLSVWDFNVLNIAEVPREYLELNNKAVKDAIKAGVRSIPGLNIFEDTQVRIRTK